MTRRRRLLVPLFLLCVGAQEPTIRVTTTLVEVDAVVLNAAGQPVTGLTRDEFEIRIDGKPQPIRALSYVDTVAPAAPPAARAEASAPAPATGAPTAPRRRTIAIVVDDLKMSPESLHFTREALRRFVAEQVRDSDQVSILSTRGGSSALNGFTRDKRQMRAAINRIRPNILGGPASAVEAIGGQEDSDPQIAAFSRRRFAVGALASVRRIAEGMNQLPGRKEIIVVSEGVRMNADFVKEPPPVNVDEVREVAQAANRSSVVIHTLDPRGVVFPGMQAKDNVANLETENVLDELEQRMGKLRGTQSMLRFLAGETGGTAHANRNDLDGGLRDILAQQQGYYLLGVQLPEEEAARRGNNVRPHDIRVRLLRPGLTVRHRREFLGTGAGAAPAPRTDRERLVTALASPFAETGLSVRLTPTCLLNDSGRTIVRAMVHIAGEGVTFGPVQPDGAVTAQVLLLMEIDGERRVFKQDSFSLRIKPDASDRMRRGGFVYTLDQEVAKPGPVQVRVGVLDRNSGRTASSSQYLEVPDFAKGKPALAGLWMADGDVRTGTATADDVSPAVRVFARDRVFSYGLTLYNAPLNAKTGQPTITLYPRLLSEGRLVWEGKPIASVLRPGMDPRRILTGGILKLGPASSPGEYTLELRALDAGNRKTVLEQTIDFELR